MCEWCKGNINMMCMKDEGVCSPRCGYYAAKILFDDPAKTEKFAKWNLLGHPQEFENAA